MSKICYICPTYNHFIYAREALLTFFEYSPDDAIAYMPDDASPEWANVDWNAFFRNIPRDRVFSQHFQKNGGLTRSWNKGLRFSLEKQATYTICGNADILFTPDWASPLIYHVEDNSPYKMVGPVSNAPGVTARGRQHVREYYPTYKVTDDQDYLNQVAQSLRNDNSVKTIINSKAGVNGFFLFARTDSYWAYRYDKENCFRPSNPKNSKGHKNPTPLMTLNEDELQNRWRAHGALSGIVPTSFIFHYRSVSRGKRYRKGDWFELKNR